MLDPLLVLALLGHGFLWIGLVNRLHAIGARRRTIKRWTLVFFAIAAILPLLLAMAWKPGANNVVVASYAVVCWAALAATLVRAVYFGVFRRRPRVLRFEGKEPVKIDVARAAAGPEELAHHPLVGLPCNEILRLCLTRRALDVPRLPQGLDGLTIAHLSDLHLTGRVGKAYFREVVRATNELQPDLTCVTGDIVDRAVCLDWLPDTLGALSARHGVYFILGNHDHRVDMPRLRRILTDCGLIDLGGRWISTEIRGMPVALAGNERPWTASATLDADGAPVEAFRIALVHTPDQLDWARANGVDLMLSGHTHGGQIRVPPLGAIFSPCFHGVKHVGGVFHVPPTVLHVSRGVSGDTPVRWNCPPEVVWLQLRREPPCEPRSCGVRSLFH
jgi:uncharacterized protein